MDMIWDTPPEKGTRTGKWATVATELKANPTKWAKLRESKDRNAHSLSARLRNAWGDDYEVISRTIAPKIVDGELEKQAGVWARYVGPTTTTVTLPVPETEDTFEESEMDVLVHEFDDAIDGGGAGI